MQQRAFDVQRPAIAVDVYSAANTNISTQYHMLIARLPTTPLYMATTRVGYIIGYIVLSAHTVFSCLLDISQQRFVVVRYTV